YRLVIERFDPSETPSYTDYPEDQFFLRCWHPVYEDYVDLTPAELMVARSGKVLEKEIVFHRRRARFFQQNKIAVPDDAVMGITLYARTRNDHGQMCIKQNGSPTPEISFWDVHRNGFLGSIKFNSFHLEGELKGGERAAKQSIKATIGR